MRQEIGRTLQRDEVIRVQYGDSDNPHGVLGRHMTSDGQVISAYHPSALSMKVLFSDGREFEMELAERTKIHTVYIPVKESVPYTFHVTFEDGNTFTCQDPYRFKPQISDLDMYLFGKGTHYSIYEKLGAHPMTIDGTEGTYFAVWAPGAKRVSVVGDFCYWDGRRYPMRRLGGIGIFELFIPGMNPGTIYKYEIKTREGNLLLKSDPYGISCQLRPHNASLVVDVEHYQWSDQQYMESRRNRDIHREPMSVYEVHLPSWKRTGKNGCEMLNYRKLAHELADYVTAMGYTHVELMGIMEHPFDGSWGYQVTGYYAPTSRHGTPEDFMYLVDHLHKKGIGVILDWVPGHFSKDKHGLAKFDGTCLYEHPDPNRGEQPEWDTAVFHYEKNEVKNFLIANALFWLKKFHVDGLRMDAVASMLYLDYGRKEGQWIPNERGGNENLEAVEFIKHLNAAVKEYGEGGYIIAEESTAWPGVSWPLESGGLGFDLKWNMGWMHDFLTYMRLNPAQRRKEHSKLIFSMTYAYTERYMLTLSHDEVVHEKGSLIRKMPGEDFEQFANLRMVYGFMFGHPGKKLLFMGQEFAQWAEWDESRSLDWHLLNFDLNKKMKTYVSKLLHLYKEYKSCYELDEHPAGFQWMSCENNRESIVSFVRRAEDGKKSLLFVCNFAPVVRENFRVGVPGKGCYYLILNSDDEKFGGTGRFSLGKSQWASEIPWDGREESIEMTLPPLTTLIYEFDE